MFFRLFIDLPIGLMSYAVTMVLLAVAYRTVRNTPLQVHCKWLMWGIVGSVIHLAGILAYFVAEYELEMGMPSTAELGTIIALAGSLVGTTGLIVMVMTLHEALKSELPVA